MAESAFKINRVLTLNPQGSVPSSPVNGDMYYDSNSDTYILHQDGKWINLTSRVDVASAASLKSAEFTAVVVQNSIIRVTGSTPSNIHGLTASVDAKQVVIYNNSSVTMTVKNESLTEGTAANRVVTPNGSDVVVATGQSIALAYDSAQSGGVGRWIVISSSGGGIAAWLSGAAYFADNLVFYEKNIYTCLSNHTSSASFETDFSSGRWGLVNTPQFAANYMVAANNFESNNIQGWSACRSAAMSASKFPTSVGTGGNPFSSSNGGTTATTFNSPQVTSVNPLTGTYSLNLTTTASGTTAGDMCISPAIPIDIAGQAKVLTFKFAYKLVNDSNNLTNFSGTLSNTFGVAIYDVVNNAWIQPAGCFNFVQKTGVGYCTGTFQSSVNMTKLQVAVFCANATGATTISLYVDEIYVGQQPIVNGPSGPVGEIIATGSVTPPVGFLYCNGTAISRSQYADLFAVIGTTYGSGDGSTTFNLPDFRGRFLRGADGGTGRDPDAASRTAMNPGGNTGNSVGSIQGHAFTDHTHLYTPPVFSHDEDQNGAGYNSYVAGGAVSTGAASTGAGAETRPINASVAYHIRYLATYQMSADTDTRVIASKYTTATTSNGPVPNASWTFIDFGSREFDTASMVSGAGTASWQMIAPVTGIYKIASTIAFTSAAAGESFISYSKNGGARVVFGVGTTTANNSGSAGSVLVQLNTGDNIRIEVFQNTAASRTLNTTSFVCFERLSGPAVVQAAETVAASYATTATTTITTSDTPIPFGSGTKYYDTHNSFSGSTYTCPVSGKYTISSLITTGATGWLASTYIDLKVIKAGSAAQTNVLMRLYGNGATISLAPGGSTTMNFLAGDIIQVVAALSAGSVNLVGDLRYCHVEITRVGN